MIVGKHSLRPCGKKYGKSTYVHKYFASKLPNIPIHMVHAHAGHLPKDFLYDIIRYDPDTYNISFIRLINFDTADVPLVGDSYLVRSDIYAANCKDGKKVHFTPMKSDPQIKVHKWFYVPENYKYFNWDASVRYWQNLAHLSNEILHKVHKLSDWIKFLDDHGLEKEAWHKLYLPSSVTSDLDKRII